MPGLDLTRCFSEATLDESKPQAYLRQPGLPTPRLHGHGENNWSHLSLWLGGPHLLSFYTIVYYYTAVYWSHDHWSLWGHSAMPVAFLSMMRVYLVPGQIQTKEIIWETILTENQNKISPLYTYFFFLFSPEFWKDVNLTATCLQQNKRASNWLWVADRGL